MPTETKPKNTHDHLPSDFIKYLQGVCPDAKHGSRTRFCRFLVRKLKAWRIDDEKPTYAIPGYKNPPPNQPGYDFPRGWSTSHLMHHIGKRENSA